MEPEKGFLRLTQIIGDRKKGIAPIVPVSRSSWWLGIRTGKYPAPIKLSKRITAWRISDIQKLVEKLSSRKG